MLLQLFWKMSKLCVSVSCIVLFVIYMCGCTSAPALIQHFGSRGILSVDLSGPQVFDFSVDGRYLWVSATNCYDIIGCRRVGNSCLDERSAPLPRMMWRGRIFKKDEGQFSYRHTSLQGRIEDWASNKVNGDSRLKLHDYSESYWFSELTFRAHDAPLVTFEAFFSKFPGMENVLSLGEIDKNADACVHFRSMKVFPDPNQRCCNIVFSGNTNHVARIYDDNKDCGGFIFSDVNVDFDTGRLLCEKSGLVSFKELNTLVNERFLIKPCGGLYAFLNDDYFAFFMTSYGRWQLWGRDYLFVYGFREKRLVKVFKSRLQVFGRGIVRDIDIALSADGRYLAASYNGVLTVYPFAGF